MRNTRSLGYALFKTIRLLALCLGTLFLAASVGAVPPISVVTDVLLGLRDVPFSDLTDSPPPNVIFEDIGTIIALHGLGCAKSERAGKQQVLRVEQRIDIPSYASNATVFLNGWRLQYLPEDDDHHVFDLWTAIRDVRLDLEGQTLKWEAIAALNDINFDDAYRWCYRFTAFAWDPSKIKLSVDDTDGGRGENGLIEGQNFFAGQNLTDSAGVAFPRFVKESRFPFPQGKPVAILPRGFEFIQDDDHHLLQIAYNLDHSERFIDGSRKYFNQGKDQAPIENHNRSLVDSLFSWETTVIFKDDAGHRDYSFGELVSVLSGDDVGLIQPPFSSQVVRPNCRFFCAGTLEGRPKSEEFTIVGIPFQYAIPVLTGWELRYLTKDQHVNEMGVSIDEAHYEKDPQSEVGTLRYKLTSVLRDKDGFPDFASRHRVTVVGLRPTAGGAPPIPLTK